MEPSVKFVIALTWFWCGLASLCNTSNDEHCHNRHQIEQGSSITDMITVTDCLPPPTVGFFIRNK